MRDGVFACSLDRVSVHASVCARVCPLAETETLSYDITSLNRLHLCGDLGGAWVGPPGHFSESGDPL